MDSNSDGVINLASSYSVTETINRFEAILKSKGVQVFARIDQQQAARQVGLDLRPTILLLFGSPKAGTPVMQASPGAALDLPLKVLAWQDESGQVWLCYNDFAYLKQRHHLSDELIRLIAGSETLIRAALQTS